MKPRAETRGLKAVTCDCTKRAMWMFVIALSWSRR